MRERGARRFSEEKRNEKKKSMTCVRVYDASAKEKKETESMTCVRGCTTVQRRERKEKKEKGMTARDSANTQETRNAAGTYQDC